MPSNELTTRRPTTIQHATRQLDQPERDCLQTLTHQFLSQNQAIHRRLQVHCRHHGVPSCCVYSEMPRRKPASRQIFLHDGMSLFRFHAPFPVPPNRLFPGMSRFVTTPSTLYFTDPRFIVGKGREICQTGLGRQISGEGTRGMGRAFQ